MRRLCVLMAAGAVWLAGAGLPSAEAAFLSDFVKSDGTSNGATFTFDGLTYSNFTYTAAPSGVQPTASAVTVTGYIDSFNNPGIMFGGAFVPTGTTPQDYQLTYTVTTAGHGFTGVNLFGNPTVTPTVATGSVIVTETVGTANNPSLGQMQIYAINGPNGDSILNNNSLTWSTPYKSINVTKDILVSSGTGIASISIVDQSYVGSPPPPVPEPASLVLMSLGCLGVIGYGLNRQKSMAY